MVRFSDMLGGSDKPERSATPAPIPEPPEAQAPIPEPPEAQPPDPEPAEIEPPAAASPAAGAPEPDDAQEEETPEKVLDRLTQYAAEHIAELPTNASGGDDLLPRGKGRKRR